MDSTISGNPRVAFRMKPDLKARIEEAAALLGLTVTDFVVSTMSERADEVIERSHTIKLSNRDRDRFLAALSEPAEPDPPLMEALRRQRERGTYQE